MKKQVVFISGGEVFDTREDFKKWLLGPESDFMLPSPGTEPMSFWSRNLQEDLGDEYEVLSISMPLKQHAHYDEWKIWFEKHIQFMQEDLVLIGWSLGANFLIKYLSENTLEKNMMSLHLVAGCTNEFKAKDGFMIPVQNTFVYHAKNDEIVGYEEALKIKEYNPEISLVTYEDKGHFLVEHIEELIANIKK